MHSEKKAKGGNLVMFTALYIEINIFCVVIVTMICIWSSRSIEASSQMSFNYSLFAIIAFILTDMAWHLMKWDYIPQIVPLALILKSIYFLSTTEMCYFWFNYYERVKESLLIVRHPQWLRNLTIITVQVIMTIFNFPFGFFFYYSDGFIYNRGPLFMLQYLFAYSYIIISLVSTAYDLFHHKKSVNKKRDSGFFILIVMAAISGFVQLFNQDFPIACACIAAAVLYTYKNILDDAISIDSLTRLNNRRSIMNVLNDKWENRKARSKIYVFMIDVDFFKKINDNYGHVEGDHALKTVADALREAAGQSPLHPAVGRYGGDEFIAVLESSKREYVDEFANQIRERIDIKNQSNDKGYKLGLSIGIACEDNQDTDVKDLISKADSNLYEVKLERHKIRT